MRIVWSVNTLKDEDDSGDSVLYNLTDISITLDMDRFGLYNYIDDVSRIRHVFTVWYDKMDRSCYRLKNDCEKRLKLYDDVVLNKRTVLFVDEETLSGISEKLDTNNRERLWQTLLRYRVVGHTLAHVYYANCDVVKVFAFETSWVFVCDSVVWDTSEARKAYDYEREIMMTERYNEDSSDSGITSLCSSSSSSSSSGCSYDEDSACSTGSASVSTSTTSSSPTKNKHLNLGKRKIIIDLQTVFEQEMKNYYEPVFLPYVPLYVACNEPSNCFLVSFDFLIRNRDIVKPKFCFDTVFADEISSIEDEQCYS